MADARQNFIDGKWVDAQDGARFDVLNPATGEVIAINQTQPAPTDMPWGGYEQSGIGRQLGKEGVEDFQMRKSVYLNLS